MCTILALKDIKIALKLSSQHFVNESVDMVDLYIFLSGVAGAFVVYILRY
jgi:hypothetical protein